MVNRFTLHDTADAPAGSAEILSGVHKAWGFVPNLNRVLAERPAALGAYLAIIHENERTYCMASNLSRMAKVDANRPRGQTWCRCECKQEDLS